MPRSKFIRLSYETFRALVEKKCVKCPLRDGCPDLKKTIPTQRRKTVTEEIEEKPLRFYF